MGADPKNNSLKAHQPIPREIKAIALILVSQILCFRLGYIVNKYNWVKSDNNGRDSNLISTDVNSSIKWSKRINLF